VEKPAPHFGRSILRRAQPDTLCALTGVHDSSLTIAAASRYIIRLAGSAHRFFTAGVARLRRSKPNNRSGR
jgi:hypothetical protein